MRRSLFACSVIENEHRCLGAGLHSKEVFVLRRGQILLIGARSAHALVIAQAVGCDDEAVRDVVCAFGGRR